MKQKKSIILGFLKAASFEERVDGKLLPQDQYQRSRIRIQMR